MATVNLGSIKFKWKGTYSGATAYTVDDVVEYNGSSYICKLASTGNLPTNTTYFDVMSSAGTNGTNRTDVGTVITTQGDILYRHRSGLQRLGAGTAGDALITGGTGANPYWGSVAGGKILQMVTATDTSARSTTSTSFVTASSTATVNITPSATSSKIFVICTGNFHTSDGDDGWCATIYRDATNLGNATSGLASGNSVNGICPNFFSTTMTILDSPNTTSQITYQLYIKTINADSDASTTSGIGYTLSGSGNPVPTHITVMEVSA